ncbi:MAG: hypothetical protein AAF604_15740 [Acidobacteriota bacterium]
MNRALLWVCVLSLLAVPVAAQDFTCQSGEAPAPGGDGVWRIFKPVVMAKEFQQSMRPRRYHQPWKKLQYVVPSETSLIEGFGSPTGGSADQSEVFRSADVLPLGMAEQEACERFRKASFSVYSKERVDREFARQDSVETLLSEVEKKIARLTSELTKAQRANRALAKRVGELEAQQAAE